MLNNVDSIWKRKYSDPHAEIKKKGKESNRKHRTNFDDLTSNFKITDLHQYGFSRLDLLMRTLNILVNFYICNNYNKLFIRTNFSAVFKFLRNVSLIQFTNCNQYSML